jgi:Zn-dependent protease
MYDFDIIYIVSIIIVILISMTLHEAAHAYASFWLGDYTAKLQGRLSLNPIKHIDPFLTLLLPVMLAIVGAPIFGAAKPVPINPYALRGGDWGLALVAVAGPLVNFVLAFVFFVILSLIGGNVGSEVSNFLALMVYVNLGFFVFNMIPIPPLDGSRVLYAIAPDALRSIMETMERYGLITVAALLLLFSQFIGVFIQSAVESIIALFNIVFIF